MTKSRKRREAEQRKAEAAAAAPKGYEEGKWMFVEVKQVAWRPETVDASKPFTVSIPTASGACIKRRIVPKASGEDTVLRKIGFPCSRIILQHSIGGGFIRLGYSRTQSKCSDHQPETWSGYPCPYCGGTGLVASTNYSVTHVEQEVTEDEKGKEHVRYVPITTAKRMGRETFRSYCLEKFKIDYASLLEAYSND